MQRFSGWIEEHRGEILDWLALLVDINSHTGNPAGVNRVGDQVAAMLKPLDFEETRYRREAIGDHRLMVRAGTGRQVLFSCHLDTVFPPDMGFDRCRVTESIINVRVGGGAVPLFVVEG